MKKFKGDRKMSAHSKTVLGYSAAGFHTIHYLEWGVDHEAETVVCVHGLSRNGRDFDQLAQTLCDDFRVICPDLIGRGLSDWMTSEAFYTYPQYAADITCLLGHAQTQNVHWVGTSMGGILGMFLAIQAKSPIKSLVINDIGAFIPGRALSRIASYVKNPPIFSTYERGEKYMQQLLSPFGPLETHQWQHLARHSLKPTDDGQFTLNYDPKIAALMDDKDIDLWAIWSQIACPVLIIRGEQSDILLKESADHMVKTHKKAMLVEVPNTGHAPALMSESQTKLIHQWVRDQRASSR